MLTLAVLAAALVFTVLNTSRIGMGRIGLGAVLSAAVLLYAASGRLIASRRPDNAIGWLLGSIGLSVATSMFAEQYALYGVATAPGAVPAAKAVGCLAAVGAFATVLLLFYIVLLFPDGHLPSPRWRPVLWAMVVVFAGLGHPAVPGRHDRHRRAHQRAAAPATPPTRTRWASCPATAGTATCSR